VCFIDNYRLLGLVNVVNVFQEDVILWDAAVLEDTRIPRRLVFDFGPLCRNLDFISDVRVCGLESNYELPFCADPSTQLVAIVINGDCDDDHKQFTPDPSRILLIRSEVLSGFASRIGTTSTIGWEDWSHFAKSIQTTGLFGAVIHLSYSHLVFLDQPYTTPNSARLRAFDFSLERKNQEEDSGMIVEYSEKVVSVSGKIPKGTFHLSTSNIIFSPDSVDNLVGSTSLGTLLASSGLNVTPLSPLAQRANVVVGVYGIGSNARLHLT